MKPFTYFPIPAFSDNYIWAVCNDSHAVIVDPGEHLPVQKFLSEKCLQLAAVLVTHHHPDHVGGIQALVAAQRANATIPVIGPGESGVESVSRPVKAGDLVGIPELGLRLNVLGVPGHTLDHLAYFQEADPDLEGSAAHLLCGDTLFSAGCGRLFEGTPAQMLASLDSLAALPESTQIHCAHEYTLTNLGFALTVDPGNADLQTWYEAATALRKRGVPTLPTTLGLEKAVNPFLRTDKPQLQQRASAGGIAPSDRLAIFTELRTARNSYRAS